MPRPHLPFVQRQVTRHGRKVWYFRRNRSEPRVRLPDLYGSDEFNAVYRPCLAGQPMVVRNQRQAPKTKFKGLIDLYLKSSQWQAYKPMTRKTRGHIYEKWAALGYDTEDITRSVIIEALEARKKTQTRPEDTKAGEARKKPPEQATSILTALKNLFAWAVSAGHVDRNPCEGIKGLKPKKAGVDEEDGTRHGARKNSRNSSGPIRSAHMSGLSIRSCSTLASGSATRRGSAASTFRRMARSRFGMRRRALASVCRFSPRSAKRSPPARRGGPINWPSSPSGAVRTSVKSTWGRGSAKPPIEPASSIARHMAFARPPPAGSPRPARRSIS